MASAKMVLAPGSELHAITARTGVPYISTRTEAVIGGLSVLEILAEHHQDYDGAIVAAFGDPGLGAARELYDLPIVGLAEAGMLTACMLGGQFSIVTFATALGPWYDECLRWNRLEKRCASIRALDGKFRSITAVQEEKCELLVDLAMRAVEQDGADVIVLAGAPLAGLAQVVRDRLPVPVIDCPQAAIKQIEGLIALNPAPARSGSFCKPLPKASTGLTPALAAQIGHTT